MEIKEKKYIKMKFAICLKTLIKENKAKAKENKIKGIEDHKLISSLRKLESSSGISFPIIQKISTGSKNAELTTLVALAEGLDISVGYLFSVYDKITDLEITKEIKEQDKKRNK